MAAIGEVSSRRDPAGWKAMEGILMRDVAIRKAAKVDSLKLKSHAKAVAVVAGIEGSVICEKNN